MRTIPRTDNSVFGEWWWTVDRLSLAAIVSLSVFGAILVMAASPSVAVQKHLDGFHFISRHLMILGPALLVLIAVSLLSPLGVFRAALIVFVASLFLMLAVLVHGVDGCPSMAQHCRLVHATVRICKTKLCCGDGMANSPTKKHHGATSNACIYFTVGVNFSAFVGPTRLRYGRVNRICLVWPAFSRWDANGIHHFIYIGWVGLLDWRL